MTSPVTKRPSQSHTTLPAFTLVPSAVKFMVFSYLEQGELLSSVNRVDKQARSIIAQNLSTVPRMTAFFDQLVDRTLERSFSLSLVAEKLSSFPHLDHYFTDYYYKTSWHEGKDRWRRAYLAAERFHLSPDQGKLSALFPSHSEIRDPAAFILKTAELVNIRQLQLSVKTLFTSNGEDQLSLYFDEHSDDLNSEGAACFVKLMGALVPDDKNASAAKKQC